MLIVQAIPGAFGLPSASPFCIKLITYLDLVGLEYELHSDGLRKSPTGKVPYVELDGEVVTDTHVIIPWLKDKTGKSLAEPATQRDRAIGCAAMRITEDSLYWALVYSRWFEDDGWSRLKPEVAKLLPAPLRPLLLPMIRRSVKRQLHEVGISRLPTDEVYRRSARDIEALAGLLGDNDWIAGSDPTVYDVAAFAVLYSILGAPFDSTLKMQVQEHANLVAWVERLRQKLPG